jgi:chromosomal replication initiation ATPase DnaA
MKSKAKHLSLNLNPVTPYSLDYFVRHSGVATALDVGLSAIEELVGNSEKFKLIYLLGPSGSGKTHLVEGLRSLVDKNKISSEKFVVVEDLEILEESQLISQIVSVYDLLKTTGGMMILTSTKDPRKITANPHVQSRLLAGDLLEINYPQENELRPILISVLERKNLKLSDYSINFLLKRLPLDPLSFSNIFARLNDLTLTEGRPANFGAVRDLYSSDRPKTVT